MKKIIFKNTLFLYFRMGLTLIVSLYTSRIILQTLGVDDFGIYTVVLGLVGLMGFINGSMSASMMRFFSYAIGKKDIDDLNQKFNAILLIQILQSIVLVIIFETVGVWFLHNYLKIPPVRVTDAIVVLRLSSFALLFSIIQTPFNILIVAKEKMHIFAKLSIVEVLLKLFFVYLLTILDEDKLVLHAFLMLLLNLFVSFTYIIYCKINFEEIKFKFISNFQAYKAVLNFSTWSAIGNFSHLMKLQGSNILLNIFFGVTVNAAYGIFLQLQNALNLFVNNFTQAVNPQIIKSFANNNVSEMHGTIFFSSRVAFYLAYFIAFPLLIMTELILEFWLVKVPEFTVLFVQVGIATLLIDAIARPLVMAVEATGRIKWYHIIMASVSLLVVPVSYVAFKFSFPAQTILFIQFLLSILLLVMRLFFLKHLIALHIRGFLSQVMFQVITVVLASFLLMKTLILFAGKGNSFLYLVAMLILTLIINVIVVFILGLNKSEKYKMITAIKTKLQ